MKEFMGLRIGCKNAVKFEKIAKKKPLPKESKFFYAKKKKKKRKKPLPKLILLNESLTRKEIKKMQKKISPEGE
jgi:hypothetical protein